MTNISPLLIPDDFKWSFSKLEAYHQCPLMFKLQYIDNVRQDNNAFAEYGTLCHKLLEEYFKGELEDFELPVEYEKRYDSEVKHYFPPFPKGYAAKAYEQGLDYFNSFSGFGDEYEVLAVEDKFELSIGGERFVGIVDLVLKNKSTGEIMVVDHKTKSMNSMKKSRDMFVRQLYVYAMYVIEKFHIVPTTLRFNMIKDKSFITEEFSQEKLEEVKEWIISTIDEIRFETDWNPTPSNFFCSYICSVFEPCSEYRNS